jgi:hypothetical protein
MREIADPPNVVAAAVFLDVFGAEFLAGDVFAEGDGFEPGAVAAN